MCVCVCVCVCVSMGMYVFNLTLFVFFLLCQDCLYVCFTVFILIDHVPAFLCLNACKGKREREERMKERNVKR